MPRHTSTTPQWALFLVLIAAGQLLAQPTISTIAGRTRPLQGVGGPATQLSFGDPRYIATDSAGNVYVADDLLNVVFKIEPAGAAVVYAGSQTQGFSGDGGPAVNATFNQPYALATDSGDNLYISDFRNGRIRKVDPSGTIDTVAGSDGMDCCNPTGPAMKVNLFEPSALATDGAGNVYISQQSNHIISELASQGMIEVVAGTYQVGSHSGFSGDGGPATSAAISLPEGLRVDSSGSLYFADMQNNRIRKVSADGIITTVAGNGQSGFSGDDGPATSASFNYPTDVAFDPAGNLYICDQYNNVIRKVDSQGIITTAAGTGETFKFSGDGGPATQAAISLPFAIAFDSEGNLFINDYGNRRLRMVDTAGIITTIAGTGSSNYSGEGSLATGADLNGPAAVAVDPNGNLYIADTANHRIRRVDPQGIITTAAGNGTAGFSGDGGPAVLASFNYPSNVALDGDGNVWIADERNQRVRKLNVSDGTIQTVAGNGGYGFSGDGGSALKATLGFPVAVQPAPDGSFYIADRNNNRVRKVSPTGLITTVVGNGEGTFAGDGGPADQASLAGPQGLSLDKDGNLFIADTYNMRVRKVTPDGIISTVMGCGDCAGEFGPMAAHLFTDNPVSAVPDAFGNIYVVASGMIIKANPKGIASVVVGDSGVRGFSGDGGPAILAQIDCRQSIYRCNGLALDAQNNVYVADTGNDRIRMITNPTAPQQIGLFGQGLGLFNNFMMSFDQNSGSQGTIQVVNLGTGELSFQASVETDDGLPWLSVSPASATAPAQIIVSVDFTALGEGVHKGSVTVSSDAASNSPEVISIEADVTTTPPAVSSSPPRRLPPRTRH